MYRPARGIEFKKGFVYWSLTEDAIKYALEKYKWVRKVFKPVSYTHLLLHLDIQVLLMENKY